MEVAENACLVGKRFGLTEEETWSIMQYISSDSYKINEKLRNNFQLSAEDDTFITLLDSALEKLPNYMGVVYRSLYILDANAFVGGYETGEVRQFREYFSSGTKIYDESFDIQYVINCKRGKDIRPFNKAEQEILFRRNTLFGVDKIDKYTIYMTEV